MDPCDREFENVCTVPSENDIKIRDLHVRLGLALHRRIPENGLRELKFYLSGMHPDRPDDLLTNMDFLDIWKWLERQGIIQQNNYSELKEMLNHTSVPACIQTIIDIEAKMKSQDGRDENLMTIAKSIDDQAHLEREIEQFTGFIHSEANPYCGVLFNNAAFALISKEKGGELRLSDGSIHLEIPHEAIDEDTIIWVWRPLNMKPKQLQDVQYECRTETKDGTVKYTLPVSLGPDVAFHCPVRATFKKLYLQNGVKSLKVYRRRNVEGAWKGVGSSFVDTETESVRVALNSFSSYVLGIPLSSSPQPLNVYLTVESRPLFPDQGSFENQAKVFFTLNDYSYIEEFVMFNKMNTDCEACLFLDPNSDATITWKKVSRTLNRPPSIITRETLHRCQIQSLADFPALIPLSRQGRCSDDESIEDVFVIEQNNQIVIELKLQDRTMSATQTYQTEPPDVIAKADDKAADSDLVEACLEEPMPHDLVKDVTVVYGTSRMSVNVNFGNHEETLDAIRRKWRLPEETQFELQAYCGEDGTHFDIVDDDDLKRHKNAEELIVRLSQPAAMPGQTSPGHQPPTSTMIPSRTSKVDSPIGMPLITGILLDVSDNMRESIQCDHFQRRREPWARSIFNLMDNLFKDMYMYNAAENLVFVVGVGAHVTGEHKDTFDILSTISNPSKKPLRGLTHSDKRRKIDRILSILETNGARLIRRWVTIDLIQDTVSDHDLILLLEKLETDRMFVSQFVSLLPMACRLQKIGLPLLEFVVSVYRRFTRKLATQDEITELFKTAKDLISRSPELIAITDQSVFRVHDASKIVHDCVEEKNLTDSRISELMDTVEPIKYGGAPLCEALRKATDLFTQPKYEDYKKLLFVLSDGQRIDGEPLPIPELKNSDVHVVCCYITRSDRVEAKRLYCREQDSWDEAARFMFRLSSSVETQSLPRTIFVKRGWKIDVENNETRLFLQVNHPDNIKDACDLAKNVSCSQDALADFLADLSLDLYINQATRDFTAKEGNCCYADATAAVLHLAMKRIVGRDGGYPDFYALREEIIRRYGKHGASTYEVLQEFCPKYRLHCKYVRIIGALEAIAEKRPLVARFELTRAEWASFSIFFKENEGKGILTTNEIDIKKRPRGAQTFGHAVVLTSFNSECLRLMNSWGVEWGDQGFFRIRNADVLGLQFFDVYWTEDDLSRAEKAYYREYGKRKAADLFAKSRELQIAEYECPLCERKSLVAKFSGKLTRATCPKCKREFRCGEEGNILALNMYLTSMRS